MKRKPPETEAAIMAALLTGQGVTEIARQFNVSDATVSRLKSRLYSDTLNAIEQKKRTDFGELLAGYLEETIITLTAQAKFFRDEAWLKKQSAADLAVLHGVAFDKALRFLEAMERAQEYGNESA
jgi:hypothetical protein